MKRLALALAIVALGACKKADQQPAQQTPAAAPMADTSHMMMGDTAHGMMADTSKKMAPAPAAAPATTKPAAKKPATKRP